MKMRLIAIRLDKEVADRRRQKAKMGKGSRKAPSKNALKLLDWQIMLTNCDNERLAVETTYEVYALRWRIETIFKAWKSGLGLDQIATRD